MRPIRHRPQHGQSLSRDMKAVFAKKLRRIVRHCGVLGHNLECVNK